MAEITTLAIDLAKRCFQLHGADATGAVVLRKQLSRAGLLDFLAALPPCLVAMEACATAHFWGREAARLGHAVRLIPPIYVKPFVKRQKNDMAGVSGPRDSINLCPLRRGFGSTRLY